jgi:glucokinase
VGCGLVINGKLEPALTRTEAGHMMLGTVSNLKEWEDFASGHAIKEKYDKYAYDITDDEAWKDIAVNIGRGLVVLIPLLQPDIVVVGGSIGTHFPHYKKYLRDWVEETIPSGIIHPKIVQAEHPQEAVIYGCYYYAIRHLS